MNILTFRGDESRGKEIKDILESLGGYNAAGLRFTEESYIYYFKECDFYRRNVIRFDAISDVNIDDFTIYTVDEFKEKFKFKVGDLVHLGETSDKIYTVTGIRWDYVNGEVMYEIDGVHEDWYRYCLLNSIEKKCMTQEVPKSTRLIDNLDIVEVRDNEVEIVLDGCDSVDLKDNVIRIIRMSKYPKTYKECCDTLGYKASYDLNNITTHDCVYDYKLRMLYRVLICRDAYWKIAGEQMGLNESWRPDWTDNYQKKWTINFYQGEINLTNGPNVHFVLAFPTKEMRDAFYENFKELIEECKELL